MKKITELSKKGLVDELRSKKVDLEKELKGIDKQLTKGGLYLKPGFYLGLYTNIKVVIHVLFTGGEKANGTYFFIYGLNGRQIYSDADLLPNAVTEVHKLEECDFDFKDT